MANWTHDSEFTAVHTTTVSSGREARVSFPLTDCCRIAPEDGVDILEWLETMLPIWKRQMARHLDSLYAQEHASDE